MKPYSLVLSFVALVALAGLAACTTTTTTTSPASSDPSGTEPEEDGGTPEPEADASAADAKPYDGPIGTKTEKGVKRVDVNISSKGSYTCDATCKAAGGTCTDTGGNGAGWVDRKYNNGSGTIGGRVYSCSSIESYVSGNTTMTGMYCYCDGLAIEPYVTVKKADLGAGAPCGKVCTSHGLTCSTKRKHVSYLDEKGAQSAYLATCEAEPPAAVDHYVCACDR